MGSYPGAQIFAPVSGNVVATMSTQGTGKIILAAWIVGAGLLLLAGALAIPFSASFGYDTRVVDMPLLWLFAGLFGLCSVFLLLPLLIRKTLQSGFRDQTTTRFSWLLWMILITGLLARLAMLFTLPLMEDDYQRYLWDGAVTANGYNPWQTAPLDVFRGASGDPGLERLAEQSGLVLERVNHPALRTIYPPVAQLAFALAYSLKPFSLTAWRLLALCCELVTLALLLVLLNKTRQSRLWVALYWWNPLIIKELINSGHMEVILVPLLLGALLAAMHKARFLVVFLLALAAGVKIWPGLLLPLFLRPFWATRKKLVLPLLIFTGLLFLMALPVVWAGFDQSSGFVAYSEYWKTNSALTPLLETLLQYLFSLFTPATPDSLTIVRTARLLIMLVLATLALLVAVRPPRDNRDLAGKTLFVCAVMFLLSPAQLPWYSIWFLPLVMISPLSGLLLLVPLLQFYYLSFYFFAHAFSVFYTNIIAWLIWIPVWTALAFDFRKIQTLWRGGGNSRPQEKTS